MKLAQVEVGKYYIAKVSGTLTVVQVLWELETHKVTRFAVVNVRTGRKTSMTAAKLRRLATDEEVARVRPQA